MFWKHYILRFKTYVLNVSAFFWSGIFPFILATLCSLTFGAGFGKDAMDPVPTAVVMEEEANYASLAALLDELGEKGEEQLLFVTRTDEETAKQMLKDGEVEGIILAKDSLKLMVKESSTGANILKTIVDSYSRKAAVFAETAKANPQALPAMQEALEDGSAYVKTVSLSKSSIEPSMQFFYALVAMSCMYTCFLGLRMASDIQANLSSLAARRTLTPTKKWKMMLSDYLAVLTLAAIIQFLLLLYMGTVLRVDFGEHIALVALTTFIGCLFGMSLGTFIGSISSWSFSIKMSIVLGCSMLFCFLAGLMSNYIPAFLEQNAPIVNHINPGQLIANSFYCLTYYDDFGRFTMNIITLLAMTVVLGITSVLLMRRKKYASI